MKACAPLFCLVIAFWVATPGNAQTYYNPFEAVNGDLKQGSDSNYTSHQIRSTTVLFENGTSNLRVQAKIPAAFIETLTNDSINTFGKEYYFELIVPVDRAEIQQKLTSTKYFNTFGRLTFNNITTKVAVEYMPIISGTNQQGDFNIFLSVIFLGSDFGFTIVPEKDRFRFTVTNAKVNRI